MNQLVEWKKKKKRSAAAALKWISLISGELSILLWKKTDDWQKTCRQVIQIKTKKWDNDDDSYDDDDNYDAEEYKYALNFTLSGMWTRDLKGKLELPRLITLQYGTGHQEWALIY